MRTRVVGAAIVRGGRVLAARRARPQEAAGRWELPGGKVEQGERPDGALVRELGEELGVDAEVVRWLDGVVPIGERHELAVAVVRLRGETDAVELVDGTHDRLRWLAAEELDDVDWLEPDRPFLAQVREELGSWGPTHRAIFFDQDDALLVAARLRGDGYDAEVGRERLAGEDDDEDHPWAVVTDAPSFLVEMLVDDFDGWLDEG